ncbi:MAG: hypothetical protein NTV33_08370 [Coprothermobacterota bacterium]|jgi:hypothetical protein|nr:hypothetical protein [Coprothermobacterota bacterium]
MNSQIQEAPETHPLLGGETTPPPSPPPGLPNPVIEAANRNKLAAGIALVVLGAFALLGQLIQGSFWGTLFLPGLGLFFIVWGFIARRPGLIIPGGILIGIGVGSFLASGPYATLSSKGQGGVIMLSLGGGFLLVTLLTAFLRKVHWWALIPAAVLAVIGLGLVGESAGWEVMRTLGTAWPIALIVVGVFLILWRRGLRSGPPKQ